MLLPVFNIISLQSKKTLAPPKFVQRVNGPAAAASHFRLSSTSGHARSRRFTELNSRIHDIGDVASSIQSLIRHQTCVKVSHPDLKIYIGFLQVPRFFRKIVPF